MYEKFNKKVVFVAHSMGNPTLTNFFNLQSAAWKEKLKNKLNFISVISPNDLIWKSFLE